MSSDNASSGHLVLILEPDNPCNTVITDRDTGKVYYRVWTEHSNEKQESVTKVTDAEGKPVAQWVWRDVRSDILTFEGGKSMSASAWLSKSRVPFKDSVTFKDLQGRGFKWKGNAPGLSLQLWPKNDKEHPVVTYKKHYSYKDHKFNPPKQVDDPATLTVSAMGQEILDMAIVSFCLLEKDNRIRGNSSTTMAASLAIPHTIHQIKVD
ncbi:hypothetical protein EST38_g9093 [Candolleomyces aberdarensis]|uniref:DUF6593 domain-containing protein n=1 Tax=Candolleomyces aberdarensis TaxID=2316362 RepID=A0A4Q2DBL3_9AGAR|nr:hypothetical protein EST38_g9093 [Candolleomyces aberdarensis]